MTVKKKKPASSGKVVPLKRLEVAGVLHSPFSGSLSPPFDPLVGLIFAAMVANPGIFCPRRQGAEALKEYINSPDVQCIIGAAAILAKKLKGPSR